MNMKEKNKLIEKEIRKEIKNQGLSDLLDVYPVENTLTKRPRYWSEGDLHLFKVHMWDLNKMDETELANEIKIRIDQAKKHFELQLLVSVAWRGLTTENH